MNFCITDAVLAKVFIRHSRGLYRESSILKNQRPPIKTFEGRLLDTRRSLPRTLIRGGYDGKNDYFNTFARDLYERYFREENL